MPENRQLLLLYASLVIQEKLRFISFWFTYLWIYTYFTNRINSRLDLNFFKGCMTMKLTLPIIRYIPSPGDLPLNCYGFSHNFWRFWLPMPKFFFLGQIVLLNYVLQNILCKLCVSALCMLLYTVIFMRVGLW